MTTRDGREGRFDWGTLRGRAEQRLRERKEAANQALRDPERIVHELEVHRMELEIQNEELREARVELESALARYTELFDFAPIGYVTITLEGVIREVNHAAAKLVAHVRSQLVGKRFTLLVPARYDGDFAELMRRAQISDSRESCELELLERSGKLLRVRLMATLLARAEPLLLLAVQELAGVQPDAPPVSGVVSDVRPARAPGSVRPKS